MCSLTTPGVLGVGAGSASAAGGAGLGGEGGAGDGPAVLEGDLVGAGLVGAARGGERKEERAREERRGERRAVHFSTSRGKEWNGRQARVKRGEPSRRRFTPRRGSPAGACARSASPPPARRAGGRA